MTITISYSEWLSVRIRDHRLPPRLLTALFRSSERLYPHRLWRLRPGYLQHRGPLHSTPSHDRTRGGPPRFRERSSGRKRQRKLATTSPFLDGQHTKTRVATCPEDQVLLADYCWRSRVPHSRHYHLLPLRAAAAAAGD